MSARPRERLGKWLVSGPPLAYLLVFFALPTLIMVVASFRTPGEFGGLAPLVGEDGAIARSSADAPEIDGTVKIFKPGRLKAGDWADVEITGADDYDLVAKIAR